MGNGEWLLTSVFFEEPVRDTGQQQPTAPQDWGHDPPAPRTGEAEAASKVDLWGWGGPWLQQPLTHKLLGQIFPNHSEQTPLLDSTLCLDVQSLPTATEGDLQAKHKSLCDMIKFLKLKKKKVGKIQRQLHELSLPMHSYF